MLQAITTLLVLSLHVAVAPPAPPAQPRAVYVTRLGPADHRNSKGVRLDAAEAILRQDRANYHRFRKRDAEDLPDPLFHDRGRRNDMERLLKAGRISDTLKARIVSGQPLVLVIVWPDRIDVEPYE